MDALTARLALDQLALPRGSTLAVIGAAGALGGCPAQLAEVDGLRVVADASEADEDLVRSLGADVVVRRGEAFADAVLAGAPDGVDALADAALLAQAATPAVRDGGGVATGTPGRHRVDVLVGLDVVLLGDPRRRVAGHLSREVRTAGSVEHRRHRAPKRVGRGTFDPGPGRARHGGVTARCSS